VALSFDFVVAAHNVVSATLCQAAAILFAE
jgi:hypothetical protein